MKDFSIPFGANYLPIENRNTADAEFCSTFKTTTKSNNMDEPTAMNEREILIEKALSFYKKVINEMRPEIIFLITNETDGTVLAAFYNSEDAVAECKSLKATNPLKQLWVVEFRIN